MGYSKEKASSAKRQREIDALLEKLFKGDYPESEGARYLARLYLYAHGDNRFSNVLDSISVHDYELVSASATVPEFFNGYLIEKSAFGLSIEDNPSGSKTVTVKYPIELLWPCLDIMKKEDVVNAACFTIFQGLSMALEPVARYQMHQHDAHWYRIETPKHMVLAMDAIVDGRVTACPVCGEIVYLKARENPSRFCSVKCSNTYHRRAKRLMKEEGLTVEEVLEKYPLIGRETVEVWAADFKGRG